MKSTSRMLTIVALALVGSLAAASPAAAVLGFGDFLGEASENVSILGLVVPVLQG